MGRYSLVYHNNGSLSSGSAQNSIKQEKKDYHNDTKPKVDEE